MSFPSPRCGFLTQENVEQLSNVPGRVLQQRAQDLEVGRVRAADEQVGQSGRNIGWIEISRQAEPHDLHQCGVEAMRLEEFASHLQIGEIVREMAQDIGRGGRPARFIHPAGQRRDLCDELEVDQPA